MSVANRTARMEALYAELPKIACKRLCQGACGPIVMTPWEYERIGKPPKVGGDYGATDMPDASCPLLTADGGCSVYPLRPLICRMFGVVETMRCPWGCEPERMLTGAEGWAFIERAAEIGGTARVGTAAKWVLDVLDDGDPLALIRLRDGLESRRLKTGR